MFLSRIRPTLRSRRPSESASNRRLTFDGLEPRIALSIGSEIPVNVEQSQAAVAENASGRTVVAWREAISSTTSAIKARIYNSSGDPLTGELIINDQAGELNSNPTVAINDTGQFVVAWAALLDTGKSRVRMALFTTGGENTHNLNWWKAVTPNANSAAAPSAGIDSSGNAVIAYDNDASNTLISQYDTYAKRFSNSGDQVGDLIIVSADPGMNEFGPSLSERSDGRFVIAWTKQAILFTGNPSIVLHPYSAAGASLAPARTITATGVRISLPSIAWRDDSNGVIAYQRQDSGATNDIKARTFSIVAGMGGSTVFLSPEINVRNTTAQETAPSVGINSDGDLVVAYTDSGNSVRVTEMHKEAVDYTRATHAAYAARIRSAAAMNPTGHFAVVYQTIPTGSGTNGTQIMLRTGSL